MQGKKRHPVKPVDDGINDKCKRKIDRIFNKYDGIRVYIKGQFRVKWLNR